MPANRASAALGAVAVTLTTLTACDVVYGFDLTVRVPPEHTAGLTPTTAAQVVVDFSREADGPVSFPSGFAIATLCEGEEAVQEFLHSYDDYGCAETMTITAWLVPVPDERAGEVVCGPPSDVEWGDEALGEPSAGDPTGQGTVFDTNGRRDPPCQSFETLTITLAAP